MPLFSISDEFLRGALLVAYLLASQGTGSCNQNLLATITLTETLLQLKSGWYRYPKYLLHSQALFPRFASLQHQLSGEEDLSVVIYSTLSLLAQHLPDVIVIDVTYERRMTSSSLNYSVITVTSSGRHCPTLPSDVMTNPSSQILVLIF